MSDFVQACEYNENRLCLIFSNTGPDSLFLNTNLPDVISTIPVGIFVAANERLELTWQAHGDIVWQIWYANCTRSQILTWEWIGLPTIEKCVLTPARSKFDLGDCKPFAVKCSDHKMKPLVNLRRQIYIAKILQGINCESANPSS